MSYLAPFVFMGAIMYALHELVRYRKATRPTYPTAHRARQSSTFACENTITIDDVTQGTGAVGSYLSFWKPKNVVVMEEGRQCNLANGLTLGAGITFDCGGNMLGGAGGWGVGLRIIGDDVVIRNCVIDMFHTGIQIEEGVRSVLIQSTMVQRSLFNGIFIGENAQVTLNDVGVIESNVHNIYNSGDLTLDGVTACVTTQENDIAMGAATAKLSQRHPLSVTCMTGNGCEFLKPNTQSCGQYSTAG